MSDQREFSRVSFPFDVLLRSGDRELRARGVNVSAGGFRVRCEEGLAIGSEVELRIDLGPSARLSVLVQVVFAEDGELGLQTSEIDPYCFELLQNLVRFNADDPERVDQEFDEHTGLHRRSSQ